MAKSIYYSLIIVIDKMKICEVTFIWPYSGKTTVLFNTFPTQEEFAAYMYNTYEHIVTKFDDHKYAIDFESHSESDSSEIITGNLQIYNLATWPKID